MKSKLIILLLIIATASVHAQAVFNGKRAHELPTKPSVAGSDILIVANPVTGKLYKKQRDSLGITGSGVSSFDSTYMSARIDTKLSKSDTVYLSNRINTKQDILVSGTTLKTINGNTLLGSGNLTISGGGGGGTLQEVLDLENVTDTGIVFDVTVATVPTGGGLVSTVKPWLKFKPLVKGTDYGTDFNMWQSSTNFNDVQDEVMMFGWGISSGGTLEQSGNGRTALALAFENKFSPFGSYNKSEFHLHYVDTAGYQHRLISTEIRDDNITNNWSFQGVGFGVNEPAGINGVGGGQPIFNTTIGGNMTLYGNLTHNINFNVDENNGYWFIQNDSVPVILYSGFTGINFGGATLSNGIWTGTISGTLASPSITGGVYHQLTGSPPYAYDMYDPTGSFPVYQIEGDGVVSPLNGFRARTTFVTPLSGTWNMYNTLSSSGTYEILVREGGGVYHRFLGNYHIPGSLSADATTSNVPEGETRLFKNTTSGNTYVYFNDGGTMKRIGPFVTY